MEARFALLLLAIVLTLSITLMITFASNVRRGIKVAFWFIFAGISAWQLNIYIADNLEKNLILANNLVFLWPPIALYAGGWFISLIGDKKSSREMFSTKFMRLLGLLFLSQLLIVSTNKIISNVYFDNTGELIFERSFLYFIYTAAILTNIIAFLLKLYFVYIGHKVGTKERKAVKIVSITIILTLLYSITSNIALPLITNSQKLISLGAFTSVILALGLSLSVTKYRFLDIRLIVARSVAYVFSIGLVITIYAFISSAITSYIGDTAGLAVNAAVVALAILSYPFIKNFFDKATNQIFYRDAYDPQQFLNELNNTVVENIEIGILLRHTTSVIKENIKSQFCYVRIEGTSTTKERLIGTGKFDFSKKDSETIREEMVKTGRQTIITDELSSDSSKLKEVLLRNEIGMIVRLLPGGDMSKETMYYLILGDKKSGNVYNKQDIRILEIIADEMLIATQNSLRFEEIEQFNVTLQQKVNDATAKLQRTNKKLRELDETKDEFISMASHQLRTPLTSVKGYMSMVLEGDAGKISKQQRELLNQAFVSSQRMVYLIADLLNVSRLKTGKFIIEPMPTNLAEVIEGEIGQLRETAKAKKIEIEYEKPKDFPTLALDETKIRQVIMNFSDNAIYYTPRGGKIRVELSEDKSNVYFKVVDNGLGVPKRDQPHLFTKFYRGTNARKARPDGTGLGLFMAKKVIDNQGGNILFESEENKGSTFGFCFNKKKHRVKKHS